MAEKIVQILVIKSTLQRVKQFEHQNARKGGIIWQTQGSGKSLTMVLLARNLALDPELLNPRIVLVTDRDDLDRQLGNTFAACGLDASRATSGRNLLELVVEKKAGIITTTSLTKLILPENIRMNRLTFLFWLMKAIAPNSVHSLPACARCFQAPAIWALPARRF